MNVLGMQAWHPELFQAFNIFQGHLLYRLKLTSRQRELIVLRVAYVRDSDYEWAQHAATAEDNGIRSDEVPRLREPLEAHGWSDEDRVLLQATDEMLDEGYIGDETWTALSGVLDDQRILEVIFTAGAYDVLATALRTFVVPLDEDLEPFAPTNGGD